MNSRARACSVACWPLPFRVGEEHDRPMLYVDNLAVHPPQLAELRLTNTWVRAEALDHCRYRVLISGIRVTVS